MTMTTYTVFGEDEEGYSVEYQIELPTRFEVCPRCEGVGSHLHPAIGEHAYTPEEFNESFDDEEAEQYFKRGGRYDVQCEECHGARVVSVIDYDRCTTDEQKAALADIQRDERSRAECDSMARQERMMGA